MARTAPSGAGIVRSALWVRKPKFRETEPLVQNHALGVADTSLAARSSRSLPGMVLGAMLGDQTFGRDHTLMVHSSRGDGKGTGTLSIHVSSFREDRLTCNFFFNPTCPSSRPDDKEKEGKALGTPRLFSSHPPGLCLLLQTEKQRLCPSWVCVQNPERVFHYHCTRTRSR